MKTTGLTLIWFCFVTVGAQRPLEKYNVDRSKISVSGASSGACMATQLHVAFSSLIMGAGILAGIPYFCAQGDPVQQAVACAFNPEQIIIDELVTATNRFESVGDVDATSNMFNSRVFILNGLLDTTVDPEMGVKVQEYYSHYVSAANIITNFDLVAAHTFPTVDYGNACDESRSPFLSICDYNAAYETLNVMYPGLERPGAITPLNGDFYEFDQGEFFLDGTAEDSSMDEVGFVYVPSGCMTGENVCRLHVAIHGCLQGRYTLDDEFAMNAGYNEVGELNNIIILYPQTVNTLINPMGCWDWWGYTDTLSDFAYATKRGQQPSAIASMIDRVS
jgi:poly(3-hydroxybutyrate) depolymerase